MKSRVKMGKELEHFTKEVKCCLMSHEGNAGLLEHFTKEVKRCLMSHKGNAD